MNVMLMIDGQDTAAEKERTFDRRNPVDGTVASRAAAGGRRDAVAAANAAEAAFQSWSLTGPGERRSLLLRAADIMSERAAQFVDAIVAETGANSGWAHFNVGVAAGMLREAGAMTTQITGDIIPSDKPGCMSMALREPAGVVLGIAPWNAPVILGVRAIAMPLACGNTVVLKASEICPGTHRLIGDVLRDAGFPKGVVNIVTNAPEDAAQVVEELIAHPAIRRINFTGSTRVGRLIAQRAAQYLKPVLLELGGKASLIVLEDADMHAAVAAAAFGSFMNQGQICMSTERIIVVDAVADKFVGQLSAKAASLKAGNPRSEGTVLGSLVNDRAANHVRDLIEDATIAGAVLRAGEVRQGTICLHAFSTMSLRRCASTARNHSVP